LKQDYAIKSENASQLIMLADKAEVAALAKTFGAKKWQKGTGKPCTASTLCVVDGEAQTRIAKHLKLL
jgi:ribosomal protein S25